MSKKLEETNQILPNHGGDVALLWGVLLSAVPAAMDRDQTGWWRSLRSLSVGHVREEDWLSLAQCIETWGNMIVTILFRVGLRVEVFFFSKSTSTTNRSFQKTYNDFDPQPPLQFLFKKPKKHKSLYFLNPKTSFPSLRLEESAQPDALVFSPRGDRRAPRGVRSRGRGDCDPRGLWGVARGGRSKRYCGGGEEPLFIFQFCFFEIKTVWVLIWELSFCFFCSCFVCACVFLLFSPSYFIL